jgi:predicted DNA-binding transcriptional regulator AlpA
MATEPTPEPAIYNLTSLARVLGVGRTTLYDWLHSEQWPKAAKIINKRRYWTRRQIEDFLRGTSK